MSRITVIYYKTSKLSAAQCQRRIEIGAYDKALSEKYNSIYWEYVKNGTIPNMMDEDGKKVLPEYRKHPLDIQLMIADIHKVEEWKKKMDQIGRAHV